MKQLLLSLVAACSMAPAFAQKSNEMPVATQKGGMLYYGSLGGVAGGGGGSRLSSTFINSGLGYNISDHFTLGVQGGFSHFRMRSPGPDNLRNSGYEAGIFARYTAYLGPRFFVFGQADAGYFNDLNGPRTGDGLALNIHPGVGLFIGRNWALTVNADLFSFRSDFYRGASASFNVGQGYRFGVSKNFGGRHKPVSK